MVGEIAAEDKARAALRPDADYVDGDEGPPATGPAGPGMARRVRAAIRRHPLVVVAAISGAIAIGNIAWIYSHRHLGAYDPDESGYLAAALRMHRTIDPLHPFDFIRAVGGTGNGITTPLTSLPFLLAGPRDPRSAMLAQPLLMVLASVGVAGITRRMAGPLAAIAAGSLFAVLPTTLQATQSYWYGLSAAAFMALAIWALLSSDRCDNARIWWFGVAVGLMFLSRTMTIGFAPAVAVAGLIVAGGDRRRLLRLAGAGLVAVAVAGPWYFHNRESIFDYLFSYGYGERAARFGSGNVLDRAGLRVTRLDWAIGTATIRVLVASAAVATAFVVWRWWRGRAITADLRPGLAVAAALAVGMAALVSTSNNGVWFELPLITLVVPLLVAVIASGPRWLNIVDLVLVGLLSALLLAQSWWIVPFEPSRPTAHYEYGFAQYDPRFSPERRDEHAGAAADWWSSVQAVEAAMHQLGPDSGDAVFTVSGNMQLFNANSLALAGELNGRDPLIWVPDTAAGRSARAAELTPAVDSGKVERVLVIADHDQTLFTPDTAVDRFAAEAALAGWVEVESIRLPDGGEVHLLRHEDAT